MYQANEPISLTAGATVSRGRYVKLSSGKVIHATASSDNVIGVSASDGTADSAILVNLYGGLLEVEASAAIAVDALITATTAGKAVSTTSAAARILGTALTACSADGEFITVLHQPTPSHKDA